MGEDQSKDQSPWARATVILGAIGAALAVITALITLIDTGKARPSTPAPNETSATVERTLAAWAHDAGKVCQQAVPDLDRIIRQLGSSPGNLALIKEGIAVRIRMNVDLRALELPADEESRLSIAEALDALALSIREISSGVAAAESGRADLYEAARARAGTHEVASFQKLGDLGAQACAALAG